MDLSIVILHHGSPKEVTANLQALKAARLPKKTEVFVINNGQKGANAKIPFDSNLSFDLRYFEIENQGYPQGNNFGLRMAKGKFLCILNPDIEVKKNTFEVVLSYLQAHPRVGIAAPRLRYPDGSIQDNYRSFPRLIDHFIKRLFLRHFFTARMRRYLMWNKDPSKSEAVDWLTGAFQVFTRKAWNKVGPNDERYFLFMSDVDICRQAWARGFEVHFVGETEALHNDARLSSGGLLSFFTKPTLRIHLWDALKYYKKFFGRALPKI
jgi:hypothetical protein